MSPCKPFSDCAGYVCSLRAGAGHGWVVVYRAEAQGIDVAGMPWATVCETHSTLIGAPSQRAARAHMKAPAEWCEDCRAEETTVAHQGNEAVPGGTAGVLL